MSNWGQIVNKAFQFNAGIRHGNPNVMLKTTTGAPSGLTAPVGTLLWNSFDSNAYICTVADTTWVKINA